MTIDPDVLPKDKSNEILLIGTNSNVLDSLNLILKDDYSLTFAACIQEVGPELSRIQPDIIILEVELLDKNTYEVCLQIRSISQIQYAAIIIITSDQEMRDRALGYEAGADDIVTRPFHSVELKTKLKNLASLREERERKHLLEMDNQSQTTLPAIEFKSSNQETESAKLRLKKEIERSQSLERQLKNSEEKFRNVVNQARDGIFVAQGSYFRYINPKMVDITGYSYRDLLANPLTMVIHPEDKRKVVECHKRRLEEENVINRCQFRLVTPPKQIKWVELRVISTIWWEGKPAILGYILDLTAQRKKQEAAIQTEKMISVSGVAAGIAHEINNPLAGIMQSVQNIIRRFDPLMQANIKAAQSNAVDLEKVHGYMRERNILTMLQGIWHHGDRASKVIQNMLHFVKKNETHMKPTNLNQVIDHSIDLLLNNEELQQKYQINYIEIQRQLSKKLPDIPCLKSEIQKVLINVLINAVQSVSENRLERLPKIIVSSKLVHNKARIVIEDNGSGINIMTQRRIFEPFFSTRPIGEGQGIGLSISYMVITHNHDGSMEVESDSEWGTRIIIELPIKRPVYKQINKNLINVLSDLH